MPGSPLKSLLPLREFAYITLATASLPINPVSVSNLTTVSLPVNTVSVPNFTVSDSYTVT